MTTEAETILRMIEAVDPVDTAKLDEVDGRVWCYLKNRDWEAGFTVESITSRNSANWYRWIGLRIRNKWTSHVSDCLEYTRSRDALKAIRPKYWLFDIETTDNDTYAAWARLRGDTGFIPQTMQKTEELAELHAIIQAIEYERQNGLTSP